jgi:hypothetical protein
MKQTMDLYATLNIRYGYDDFLEIVLKAGSE